MPSVPTVCAAMTSRSSKIEDLPDVDHEEFKVVCIDCMGIVAHASCSKAATDRDKDTHGTLGWEASSQAMEACLARKCWDQLKADGFEVAHVTLDGDASTPASFRAVFKDGCAWRCFSHLGVNFKAQLVNLQAGKKRVPAIRHQLEAQHRVNVKSDVVAREQQADVWQRRLAALM